MSEVKPKPLVPADYLYHLPDKPLPQGSISYEEFLEWVDEDTHAEWVDGEIHMTSPASYKHQNIKGFLESVFREFVEAFDLGEVLSAGFQMKLPGKSGSGREPDIIFISKPRLNLLRKTFLDGPADLAIEVVSPESIERDRITKLMEYAAGGVLEYWLLDPNLQEAIFYGLDPQGQYQAKPLDSAGKYYSQVIAGFWLKPEWLWREPLPAVKDVLKLVGGAAYQNYLTQPPASDL